MELLQDQVEPGSRFEDLYLAQERQEEIHVEGGDGRRHIVK